MVKHLNADIILNPSRRRHHVCLDNPPGNQVVPSSCRRGNCCTLRQSLAEITNGESPKDPRSCRGDIP